MATKGEKNLENHRCIRYCPCRNPFHTMLTGSDLLAKVKELGDVSKSDLVRSCGYVSTKKDGGERLNFTAFYEALLEAKGLSLGNDGVGRGKGGRKLSYTATVQGNGNLLIGKAYTIVEIGRASCRERV